MNSNLEKARFDMKKVESLMIAYENTYLDIPAEDDCYEMADHAGYAFYAIWDAIRQVASDIEKLDGAVKQAEEDSCQK